MLRSIANHFNETVLRGPEDEGGAGGGVDDTLDTGIDAADDTGDDGGDEGGSDEPLTVREQIKKSIAEANEDDQKPKTKKSSKAFGDRPTRANPEQANAPANAGGDSQDPAANTVPAPEALSREAKAEWDKTPPAVQAAFIKREQDMANGVQELKQRYNLIDQAIAPHNDALRQMNATPADAVNRMFLWFKALAGKPTEAFPALAQSMGIDWKQMIGAQAPAADGTAPDTGQANGGAPAIPDEVKQYVGSLEQKLQAMEQYVQGIGGQLGGIQQNFNQQSEQKTRENLSFWSKDKPYYDEVRQDMAKLIETGVVPLKDGQVDLDTAYERAIYFNPEVRAKVLAEQQQANTNVQQQQTEQATTARQAQVGKAKRAAVSLPAGNAPNAGGAQSLVKKKPGQKQSVRDSLKAAMAELRDQ